jgi:hypothetical protein
LHFLQTTGTREGHAGIQVRAGDLPTWPDGQFNPATLAAENKDYDTAILHMKEFLELVPESPDTQVAKDNIIIWRDRVSSFLADDNKAAEQPRKASFMNTRK